MSKKLVESILKASQAINTRAKRGSADYMIVSSDISKLFNSFSKKENRKNKIKNIFGI